MSSENVGKDEGSKVDPLHLKAMFRRSKALYELGNFFRAAMDVSECLIQEPFNEQFKTHMEKVSYGAFRLIALHLSMSAGAYLSQQLCTLQIFVCVTWVST